MAENLSGELIEDDFRFLASGNLDSVKRDYPIELGRLVASYGSGAYLRTTDGRRFLDYVMGYGSLILGHAYPTVVKAVAERAKSGLNFALLHEAVGELARLVNEMVPCAEKVQFVGSGTEATMLALRLARAYTGREKILKFDGAYHGFHDGLFFNTNYKKGRFYDDSRLHAPIESTPDSNGIPRSMKELVLVAPYNDQDSACEAILKNKNELCAVILEPVMRGIESKPGFLEAIRETTEKFGVPLIFDEVITGFRLAPGGAQEYYGVTPDLATYSKVIGGGLPMGAVAGKEEIMSLLHPDAQSHRKVFCIGYGHGNTLSYAASLATLREMKKPGMYEKLNGYGNKLREELGALYGKTGLDYQMTGAGSIVEYFFMKEEIGDYNSVMRSDMKLKRDLWHQTLKNGIYGLPGRYFTSTAHGQEELETTLSVVESSLRQLKKER